MVAEEQVPLSVSNQEQEHRDRLQRVVGEWYELRECLGRGGFGAVYVAWDVKLEREVAIKAMRHDLFPTPELHARFEREAKALAALHHPNILAIHFVGEGDGISYMVMPRVAGESLKARLDREGALSAHESRRILAEVASALDVAHGAGLVHRDVKPENILLDERTGLSLLMDFGIAKGTGPDAVGLTSTGVLVGTPLYMSPEQVTGESVIPQSDIYSLGVVGFEMLTGQLPFDGSTAQKLIYQHAAEKPPDISSLRRDLSPELGNVVMRCLEKSPDARWESAGALADTLRTVRIAACCNDSPSMDSTK